MIHANIRVLDSKDVPHLLHFTDKSLSSDEIRERVQRLLFINANVPTCYVALDSDQTPCAMCWLITANENKKIEHYFKHGLASLKPTEVYLEFVFVLPEYRGNGLMQWITENLFLLSKSKEAKRAIAFVRGNNKVSIAKTKVIGWKPFCKKKIAWRFFKKQITFEMQNSCRIED